MKFARLIQQYKYDADTWNGNGNIGDCIQNIAVENLYKELGVKPEDLVKINRDELSNYNGEPVILPMQGWFGNTFNVFSAYWSDKIHPVFFGFHLNSTHNNYEKFIETNGIEKTKNFEPIGCRDRKTQEFFKKHKIDAYFSACMTLTYDKRPKSCKGSKIFVVDVHEDLQRVIPSKILKKAEFITHNYLFPTNKPTLKDAEDFEATAREVLEIYKNHAKLIITSRIHCALPCVAIGIPVIFLTSNNNDERYDLLKGILPIYTPDMHKFINWNPKAPNIENLKQAIKTNAKLQIINAAKTNGIQLNVNINTNHTKLIKKINSGKHMLLEKIFALKHKHFEKDEFYKLYFQLLLLEIFSPQKKVALWGASLFLQEYFKKFPRHFKNIKFIIDKSEKKQNQFINGYKIVAPDELNTTNIDRIILTIENKNKKISDLVAEFLKINHPKTKFKNLFEIKTR